MHAIDGLVVLALAAILFAPCAAQAAVHESIVIDAQTGEVLHAYNANQLAHPASLAKLMTLYIVFQRLESGKLKLNEELHVSRHAAAQQPTKLWLRPGSEITVRSAILGITTRSANDAAVVLAEAISRSEAGFAQLMTRRARELGMKNTRFYNATGLPNARQWTTANDMARLALVIINRFPNYYHFFSARSFRFHGHTIYGHDHLLNEYAGTDGLKTGYIRASGYNIVTSVVRRDRRLVGVVMGGRTAHARDQLMMALLNRGFATGPDETIAADDATGSAGGLDKQTSIKLVSATEDRDVGTPNHGHWVVQIGKDFSSKHSVRRVLKSAIRSAPHFLKPSRELVVKLQGRHYRARFSQMSEGMAIGACRTLLRKQFTCTVFRVGAPENDLAGVANRRTSRDD